MIEYKQTTPASTIKRQRVIATISGFTLAISTVKPIKQIMANVISNAFKCLFSLLIVVGLSVIHLITLHLPHTFHGSTTLSLIKLTAFHLPFFHVITVARFTSYLFIVTHNKFLNEIMLYLYWSLIT